MLTTRQLAQRAGVSKMYPIALHLRGEISPVASRPNPKTNRGKIYLWGEDAIEIVRRAKLDGISRKGRGHASGIKGPVVGECIMIAKRRCVWADSRDCASCVSGTSVSMSLASSAASLDPDEPAKCGRSKPHAVDIGI